MRDYVMLLHCVLCPFVICATLLYFCYISDVFWCIFYPAFWNKNCYNTLIYRNVCTELWLNSALLHLVAAVGFIWRKEIATRPNRTSVCQ